MRTLITTVPFGEQDRLPLDMLEAAGVDYVINPLNRKLCEDELAGMVGEYDILIAGTEPITAKVMAQARRLKLISRVGIGLDSVDLLEAERREIKVSYTPDAPAPAVAELTVGMMLTLLRHVHISNVQMHKGEWQRYFGRRLSECTVGIIGMGRIGSRVLKHISGFDCKRVLLNDIEPCDLKGQKLPIAWVEKEVIYKEADLITLHLPLTGLTQNLIRQEQLSMMKSDTILINTARGGIINEKDLFSTLKQGHLSGAAIDVFEQEPYNGDLQQIERCLLTSHMGSMSVDCRTTMEIEATAEAIRFAKGEALQGVVPVSEYAVQRGI